MEQSADNPIATRTRSQQSTTQHMTSHETTEHQEIEEEFSKMNVDAEATSFQQQENRNNEMKNEQINNFSNISSQLHHLQETFAMKLAQKQKIIEDQQRLLLQLQLNVQELSNGGHNDQYREDSSQAIMDNDNFHLNSDSDSLPQRKPPPMDNEIGNNTSKYDNFIEQQSLKDKVMNIRKFSGKKYDDVDEWLENIEHDFSVTLVGDEIKLKLIPKSLTNDAKNWFEQNKHRLTSWKIFKVEIKNGFQSSLHKDQKFIDAIEKLCFHVNPSMTEQEKMLYIKAGFKTSLKEKVLDKQPQSMHQLRNIVKRIEDIETMLNDRNNNETQSQQPPLSSDLSQSQQDDGNCYALPLHFNNSRYQRNNYRYNQQQQQQINQKEYRQIEITKQETTMTNNGINID